MLSDERETPSRRTLTQDSQSISNSVNQALTVPHPLNDEAHEPTDYRRIGGRRRQRINQAQLLTDHSTHSGVDSKQHSSIS